MCDGQRLVIVHDSESVLAKFGCQVITRPGGPFEASLAARIERDPELDPELPLLEEVAPPRDGSSRQGTVRVGAGGCN
jgi:hypothetical protein